MGKNDAPQSFAEIIDEVQSKNGSVDPASPFSKPLPPGERLVDTAGDMLRRRDAYEYKSHTKTFNLYGEEGATAYDELQSRIANSSDLLLRRDEIHWTKEGDCLALVQWIEFIPKKVPPGRHGRDDDDDDDDRRS